MDEKKKWNENIYEEIRGFSFIMNQFFEDTFNGSEYCLTPLEVRILYILDKSNHLSATYFSNAFHLDPSFINRLFSRFIQNGLVKKNKSDTDHRAYDLYLTEKGHETCQRIERNYTEKMNHMLHFLSEEEKDEFIKSIHLMKRIVLKTSMPVQIQEGKEKDLLFAADRFLFCFDRIQPKKEAFRDFFASRIQNSMQEFSKGNFKYFVAKVSNEVSGGLLVKFDEEKNASIRYFFVEPTMRYAGIGSLLLREMLSCCRQEGMKHVSIRCYSFQTDLPLFLRNFFFEKEKSGKTEIGGDSLSWEIYGKDL